MSCLTIIRTARSTMSANEKKLADFVLENASLIRDYSSQQIAGAVGVSQSSVVKFSQKLGYKGFTDLKLAVHESVVMQESSGTVQQPTVEGYEDELSLNDWLLAKKREALSSAAIINDNADVLAAIAAIEMAQRIQVIGSGPASVIAKDLAHKLIELGKAVTAESDRDIQLLNVATLGPKDCLLIISASGQTAHLVDAAKLAKKSGTLVISITNQWANPLRAISDIRLYSVASGGAAEISKLVVAASQQHLVDMFYCSLKQRDRHHKDAELLNARKSQA